MIYGYVRVSTDKQDTDNQRLGITNKAKALGHGIDEWITDDGVSGAKEPDDRLLGKLLKKIKRDDVIIASELSRLGRKLFMVMRILEHCMKVGAKVYTVKDGYELGDNIQSKVLAFAFGLAAEIEREMIQLRTKEGLTNKKLQGVLLGNSRTKNLNPHTPAETIEKMKELLKKGLSISTIAKKTKTHRITVAYHLRKEGTYKGQLIGFKLKMRDNSIIEVNSKTCAAMGLSYGVLKKSYEEKSNCLAIFGVNEIEALHNTTNCNDLHEYRVSEDSRIERATILKLVNDGFTIPEIHKLIGEHIPYFDVYNYISGDTELSMYYREKGHLKVRKKRD